LREVGGVGQLSRKGEGQRSRSKGRSVEQKVEVVQEVGRSRRIGKGQRNRKRREVSGIGKEGGHRNRKRREVIGI
jgi:hypothetical protein